MRRNALTKAGRERRTYLDGATLRLAEIKDPSRFRFPEKERTRPVERVAREGERDRGRFRPTSRVGGGRAEAV